MSTVDRSKYDPLEYAQKILYSETPPKPLMVEAAKGLALVAIATDVRNIRDHLAKIADRSTATEDTRPPTW